MPIVKARSLFSRPPAVGQVTPVFFSDWRTAAIGSTERTDGGKWNNASGSATMLDVVASTGLDLPTAKALRVWVKNPEQGAIMQTSSIPSPGVGESHFYRWYFRLALPGGHTTSDWQTHPIQLGNNASTAHWMFIVNNGPEFVNNPYDTSLTSSQWSAEIWPNNNSSTPRFAWPPLDKNTTYRFELKWTRVTSTTFKMWARVYLGDSTTPLFDEDDILRYDLGGGQTPSMNTVFASESWTINPIANLSLLNCGNNGLASSPTDTAHSYQAGFAVGNEDWIGPYGSIDGEVLP